MAGDNMATLRFYSDKVFQDVNTFNGLVAEMGLNNRENWKSIADRLAVVLDNVKSYQPCDVCDEKGLWEPTADCEYSFQVFFEFHVAHHWEWAASEADHFMAGYQFVHPVRPVMFCTFYGGVLKEMKEYNPDKDLWFLGVTRGADVQYHAPYEAAIVVRSGWLNRTYHHPDWLDKLHEGSGDILYEADYPVYWKFARDELGGEDVAVVGSG